MTDPDELRARSIARLPLRDRLRLLRRGALTQLAQSDRADAGMLELVAHAGAALAAIDDVAVESVAPAPGDRALVSDDGEWITITVYSADKRAAAAMLTLPATVQLARRLLDAAARRL